MNYMIKGRSVRDILLEYISARKKETSKVYDKVFLIMREVKGKIDNDFYEKNVLSLENDVARISTLITNLSDVIMGIRILPEEESEDERASVLCLSCSEMFCSPDKKRIRICQKCKNTNNQINIDHTSYQPVRYDKRREKNRYISEDQGLSEQELWEKIFKKIEAL